MKWTKKGESDEPAYTPFQLDVLRLYNQARDARASTSQRIEDWFVQVTDDGQLFLWRAETPAKRSAYTETMQACAQVLHWPEKGYELTWAGARLHGLLMRGVLI